MVGLVVVVLFAHDVPLSMHLAKIERDRLITATQRDAFTIGGQVTPFLTDPSVDRSGELKVVIDGYSRRSEGIVVVVDGNGYLVASNDPTSTLGDDYVGRPEIAAGMLGTPTSGTRQSTTLGGELVYVAVPVLSAKDVIGVVRITYPKSFIDARVGNFLQGILLTAAISVLLAAIVALLFARFVTRPLVDLRHTTERFADGNLDVIATESGPPETRKLASSFNAMARRLSQMIDQQRSFAGNASHQLKTPLTALRLRLEQAGDLLDTDHSAAHDHLDEALSETERLSHLVEQLLQLARAEGMTLSLEDFDISKLVAERIAPWSSLGEERGISINMDVATGLHGKGNVIALGEILDNYLDNALEISPMGSTILVKVIASDGSCEIVVSDEGPGLSVQQRAQSFDRFWRGDDQSNRRTGSGLGLAIVSQLANASGFQVELRQSTRGGIDAVVGVPRATVNRPKES